MSSKQQVSTAVKEHALVKAGVDMEADAIQDSGFEECDADSFAVPFLRVLQSLSPQLDKQKPEYIEGAEVGHFVNSATSEVYKEGLILIPCHYRRKFLEWKPRKEGGGLAGIHDVPTGMELLKTTTRNDKGKDVLPNGNTLEDTREHFVLAIDPSTGEMQPAVISMASTQIKRSKQWMTKMQNIKVARKSDPSQKYTPPMYCHTYKATTVYESNDQGTWYSWNIVLEGPLTDATLYEAAKQFRASIVAGVVIVKHDAEAATHEREIDGEAVADVEC